MERKYAVFRALSHACFCDLVAIKESETLFIEVRTAYKGENGKLTFSRVIRGNPTFFGLYFPSTSDVLIVPIKDEKPYLLPYSAL
ncbi:MAG: hypothetical protein KGL39_49640 [Patescibacteria group bacterium]|nr:hypothetical protein [Patescibacteria group bacterium]